MSNVKSVMIVGVGGQGTLLASRVLGSAMLSQGVDVKVSEVHGMSQRGGSVVTYIRFGETVHSPIIEVGEADYIVSFEELEALRYACYLRRGGVIVTGEKRIDPMPVITGAEEYPNNIVGMLRNSGIEVDSMDASAAARGAELSTLSWSWRDWALWTRWTCWPAGPGCSPTPTGCSLPISTGITS